MEVLTLPAAVFGALAAFLALGRIVEEAFVRKTGSGWDQLYNVAMFVWTGTFTIALFEQWATS